MNKTIFGEIGLSEGEREVYLALTRRGASTIGAVVSETGLQKSTVYFCMDKLVKKGLLSYFSRNNVKVFQAESPHRIIDYLNGRQNEIEKQKEEVNRIIPQFEARLAEKTAGHAAKVFEDWNGLKTAFDDILESLGKGDEYFVLGVTTVPSTRERFRRFIRQFHLKRAQKGIISKLILNADLIGSIGIDREQEPLTEVRYIEKEFLTPAISNIYGDKVLFTIWEPPYAFQLQSKELALSLKNYFMAVWKRAKSRKHLTGKTIRKIKL